MTETANERLFVAARELVVGEHTPGGAPEVGQVARVGRHAAKRHRHVGAVVEGADLGEHRLRLGARARRLERR